MPNSFPFYDAQPYWPAGGYGNGGGGNSGGGGSTTLLTDFWVWNNNTTIGEPTDIPSSVSYVSDISNDMPVFTDLRFDAVTRVNDGTTVYGIHIYDCPVGAVLSLGDYSCTLCYLPDGKSDPVYDGVQYKDNICLMPIDGCTISGIYRTAVS